MLALPILMWESHKIFFVKCFEKPNLSALLNFVSLYMINQWLETSDFLFIFDMKKILNPIFENFSQKIDKLSNFMFYKFLKCACNHKLNLNSLHSLCLFHTNFSKIGFKIFFMSKMIKKSEHSIHGLIISESPQSFAVIKR